MDTGTVDSPRQVLQPALAEVGLALSDIDVILNTHVHLDHTGGNLETKRASNASIHVHAADAPWARSTETMVDHLVAPLRVMEFPPEMLKQRAEGIWAKEGEAAGVDVVLSDGEVVDLGKGIGLRVIHTPGHTPGSVCYFWEAEGMLFTGDSVQGLGPRPGTLPVYLSAVDYRRSMVALKRLAIRLMCMGHTFLGPAFINDPTLAGSDCRPILDESIWAADTVHAAVAQQARRMPGASKREIALAALAELIYEIPQLLVRKTRMPAPAGPMLLSHIEAALAGQYPNS